MIELKYVNQVIKWSPLNKSTCYSGAQLRDVLFKFVQYMTGSINVTSLGSLVYGFV